MNLKLGIIGGSGLGQALASFGQAARHEIDTPFGRPSDAILETTIDGVPAMLLSRHGPGHLLNPSQIPYRANLFALKQLGCTHILASGAVGSLREEFKPRDLVLPDQFIDKTFRRAGTFYDHAAVHVELSEPFCPVMRRVILDHAQSTGRPIHSRGCYVCMEGPGFSSRAESAMHRVWGGDLIGMTALPEAKLAREAELPYALIALVTDYDSWRPHPPAVAGSPPDPAALLAEIIGNLSAATENAVELLRGVVTAMRDRAADLQHCPAREALKLAIWSDKSRIDEKEVRRLAPLWIKYFEEPGRPPAV